MTDKIDVIQCMVCSYVARVSTGGHAIKLCKHPACGYCLLDFHVPSVCSYVTMCLCVCPI